MSTDTAIHESIDSAAEAVGRVWPIHSFVTANPLAGFEDDPFHEAVRKGERLFGGQGYPSAATFRRAWEAGQIDPERLREELAAHGHDAEADPGALLDDLATEESPAAESADPTDARVDRHLTKWLAAFVDEDGAEWSMPNREAGFYRAWREVAPHDGDVPDGDDLPEEPIAAIEAVLDGVPEGRWQDAFEHHLAALPGWVGLLRQRAAGSSPWAAAHPAPLVDYLAVRLTAADRLDATVVPDSSPVDDAEGGEVPLAAVWLSAWEASYRSELVDAVATEAAVHDADGDTDDGRPAAQLVFCIDTRSEIIRRHLEHAGAYETHGYAGFFGVPMRYEGPDDAVHHDACPPILDPAHRIEDRPTGDATAAERHDRWTSVRRAAGNALESLKPNVAAAFGFVENSGGGYGAALALRTLLPSRVYDLGESVDERVPARHEYCEPTVDGETCDHDGDLPLGLTLDERVEYAATAFDLMGWEEFARLVVFTGHAGQTANNPFDSSLDCGACAGNAGGPNARVLAAICNDPAVREALRERGHEIPEDTVFLAGEHNTTTDEVTLFDGDVPESHHEDVERLREDLATARAGAATERADDMGTDGDGIRETTRRAADWAETRPEWGLAGNAAFVVGPRDLTADLNLDGRSFLHSYDPATDPDGTALEAIMTGPMVVTQWINTQYYFATVDSGAYGSGSKVTQNPVGNVGVYQGNGGDLMAGLPLQSVMATDEVPYHQPLRLSVVIHAPVGRVTDVLAEHEHLRTLLDNGWCSLTVVDPQDATPHRYHEGLEWESVEPTVDADAPVATSSAPADD
jgi:hypothetical protein